MVPIVTGRVEPVPEAEVGEAVTPETKGKAWQAGRCRKPAITGGPMPQWMCPVQRLKGRTLNPG